MVVHLIRCMRPKHWIKNFFVLAPLVFAQRLDDTAAVWASLLAFAGFSLTASSIYLLNDYLDLERDRAHPLKCTRPLPAGLVTPRAVVALGCVTLMAAALIAVALPDEYRLVLAGYFIMNVAYSSGLKNAVILDVMIIATGFVLRVVAGSMAISVPASRWLLMCTFLLALFIGFGKRRHELVVLEEHANSHREVLTHYSPYFLDQMISVVTASTVMSYALYTLAPETTRKFGSGALIFTTPFVLYGIFRYLYLVHQREEGGDPASLVYTDRPLLINVMLWTIVVVLIIYK